MQSRMIYPFVLMILLLFFLIGCSKETDNKEEGQHAKEKQPTEQQLNDQPEDSPNKDDTVNEAEDESYYEISNRKLQLGESARYKMFDQQFEITPTAFQIVHKDESVGKAISSYKHGVYFVLDLTVKNIGETDIQTIDFIDLANYYLINNNHEGRVSFIYPDRETEEQRVLAIDRFEKEATIAPGEEKTGQILFETTMAEEYGIGLGDLASDYQREAIWHVSIDEASSIADNVPELPDDTPRLKLNDEAEVNFIQGDGRTDSFLVTPTTIEVKDEIELDDEVFTPHYEDEKIVIVTLKIQNKGEYPIDEDIIAGTNTQPVLLLTNTDYRRVSRSERKIYDIENEKLDDIQPNEEVERKLYFLAPESTDYELQMGSVFKILYHNKESIWHLNIGKNDS